MSTAPTPRVSAEMAYLLPMGVFLGLTFLGTYKGFYPASYALKTVIVAGLLWTFWRAYTRITWTHLGVGVLFGVLGVVQWIGTDKLLMSQMTVSVVKDDLGQDKRVVKDPLGFTRLMTDIRHEAFRPDEYFADSPVLLVLFLAVRLLGPTLVVPVMEELFWRDWLWRTIAAPNDFKLAKVGEYDAKAFWIIPLLFASVHVQWLTAVVWGLLIAWLLVRTKSLGACIIAHGTTNFLLGIYVLISWYGFGRNEWYFW